MSNFRRWYFYVVSAISLQAVTWALIALLRNLTAPALRLADPALSSQAESIAFQISVIIIGLPMFLLHWRWAGRPAVEDGAAHYPPERFLYLYFMLGAFLVPLLTNWNGFLLSLLRLASGTPATRPFFNDTPHDRANLAYTAVAIIVLALMLLYHAHLLRLDRRDQTPTALTAALHRLFIYLFSAVGLAVTSFAAASLLQWLLLAAGGQSDLAVSRHLINSVAALITGLPLWLYFWQRAQQLFRGGEPAEQASLLRKLYLYLVIFLAVIATVSALTALLAGFFRRLLGLEPQAGSGMVLSALIAGAVVWAYHAFVLREDTRLLPLQEEQAGLRRLYHYLVAGVGLLTLLIGLGGVLGLLFDPGQYIVSQQQEELAWFSAMLLSGLAVWLIPWRKIQQETAEPAAAGAAARTSLVRRFYLFFFLLLATLTFLIVAIFILSRLLMTLLGEPLQPGDLRDMGLAAAYAIIAGLVWLYHGRLLQQDRDALEEQQARRAAALHIVVIDDGDGTLGRRLLDSLRAALPDSEITPIGLTPSAAVAMGADPEEAFPQAVATADIIIGPWSIAAPPAGASTAETLQGAVVASSARKLVLLRPAPGWEWATGDRWQAETAVRDITENVQNIVAGETAARYPSGPGMILLLIAATILILILITALLGSVLPLF